VSTENKNDILNHLSEDVKKEMNLAIEATVQPTPTEIAPELLAQYRQQWATETAAVPVASPTTSASLPKPVEVSALPEPAPVVVAPKEELESVLSSEVTNRSSSLLVETEEDHEISETFSKLSSESVAPAPTNVVGFQTNKDLLADIHIDVSNIDIIEKTGFEQQDDIDIMFNKKSIYEVVLAQSGYKAGMSALTLSDINAITNSNVDLYTHKKRLYEVIHSHLENTSVGKVGLKDWLKITSFHDLETLMYGVYCQTFPENNEFDVTCGSCNKATSLIVNNVTLAESKDDTIYAKIEEIVRSVNKSEDLIAHSMVHTTHRIVLPETKIVFDIQTPSLWDHLELLNSMDQRTIEEFADTIGTMLFIKNMYLLDVARTRATGKASYYPVDDKNRQLHLISRLGIKDGDSLSDAVNSRVEKYAISYSVKNAKCTHCSDSLGNLPIDIETALFTLIQRRNQA